VRTELGPERETKSKPRPYAARSPSITPPGAAAVLALQRTAGNSATARLLRRRPRASGRALQRYPPIHVGWGPQEEATFDDRRAQGIGFIGTSNRGWIEIGTGVGAPQRQHAGSVYNVAHTEEVLIQWAVNQGANLGLAPNAAAGPVRVLALYTERAPCDAQTADPARANRGHGNCDAMVAAVLHPATPVYYSTPNSNVAHNLLMFGHAQRDVRLTQIGRLNHAFAARIAAMRAANALPAYTALRDTWRGHLTGLAAPTVLTYNTWVANMALLANAGILALNAFQPPQPAVIIAVDPPGPKKDPGPGPPPPPDANAMVMI
jgi:hypothetical protein